MVWEYTGSAWISYLGMETAIADKTEQWQAVYDADLANGLTWGQPAPMNNTYAMAVRTEAVAELGGISKLSDIAKLPVEERTFCLEAEFNSRPDGFNPMTEAYDMPRGGPTTECRRKTSASTTRGRFTRLRTRVPATSARFSPPTGGSIRWTSRSWRMTGASSRRTTVPGVQRFPVFNTATLEKYPELEDAFAQVSPRLSDEVLRQLNLRVDVLGEDPADVAYDWMLAEGLINPPE